MTKLLLLRKVVQTALGISLHGVLALGPVGRADLAVLGVELQGVQQTQYLVHRPANGQVVEVGNTDFLLGINDEGAWQVS